MPARPPPRWPWPINSSLRRPAAAGLHTADRDAVPGGRPVAAAVCWPVIAKPADPAYARCDFPGGARCIQSRTPPGCGSSLPSRRGAVILAAGSCRSTSPARTRGSVVNAYCAADGRCRGCAGPAPLQERTPEGTGNYAAVLVEPSWQDAALLDALRGLCRRRAGTALPILI